MPDENGKMTDKEAGACVALLALMVGVLFAAIAAGLLFGAWVGFAVAVAASLIVFVRAKGMAKKAEKDNQES